MTERPKYLADPKQRRPPQPLTAAGALGALVLLLSAVAALWLGEWRIVATGVLLGVAIPIAAAGLRQVRRRGDTPKIHPSPTPPAP